MAPSVAAVAAQARVLDAPHRAHHPMPWHPALTCLSRVAALVLGVSGRGAPLLLVSVRASDAGAASALRGGAMDALAASLGLDRGHGRTWWRPLDHSGGRPPAAAVTAGRPAPPGTCVQLDRACVQEAILAGDGGLQRQAGPRAACSCWGLQRSSASTLVSACGLERRPGGRSPGGGRRRGGGRCHCRGGRRPPHGRSLMAPMTARELLELKRWIYTSQCLRMLQLQRQLLKR